jgi:phosphatidate cytidylyltransferase
MKRVLTAVILIPLVLIAIFKAHVLLLAAIVAAVSLLGVREFLDMARHANVEPFYLPTYIYTALIFLAVGLGLSGEKPLVGTVFTSTTLTVAAVFAPFVFLALGMRRETLATAMPASAASVFAVAYVALPLALLVHLRELWAGAFLLLYALIVVWTGDIAAYYTGRLLGRHKLAPRISPGKTWEGTAGSFIGAIAVGTVILQHAFAISSSLMHAGLIDRQQGYFALQPPSILTSILLSACLNVAAQLGDLVESLIKRGVGVKDSGSLLPGHGGILDRIDALLFAAPVIWIHAVWKVMQ